MNPVNPGNKTLAKLLVVVGMLLSILSIVVLTYVSRILGIVGIGVAVACFSAVAFIVIGSAPTTQNVPNRHEIADFTIALCSLLKIAIPTDGEDEIKDLIGRYLVM